MDLMLKDRVAIVTGAGEGIGRKIILTLAEEGAKIVVSDVDSSRAESVAEEARALGVEALSIKADVSSWEEVSQMVRQTVDRFGKIDILVNNAGRSANWESGGGTKPFVETEKKDWDYTIDVCLYGALNCSRAVLPHMIEKKYGKIVNMISDAGRMGEANMAAYSAAKGGVVAFTKALAREVGRYDINVNGVSAATTKTERNIRTWEKMKEELGEEAYDKRMKAILRAYPLRKIGETVDLARGVVFFCSDCTNWVTGQVLSISGGFSMVS